MKATKFIDWEERRYELAKAAMQGAITGAYCVDNITTVDGKNTINYIPPIKIANTALILADEMIKQLKESEEKK